VICEISGIKKNLQQLTQISRRKLPNYFSAVICEISGRKKPFPQITRICAETYPNIFLYGDSAIPAGLKKILRSLLRFRAENSGNQILR